MRPIFIFDLDGTCCDCSHRLHFIQGDTPDWAGFFAAAKDDPPIKEVIATANMLSQSGARIVIVTGRSDDCHDITVQWLQEHGLAFEFMYMREAGDHRSDVSVKREMLTQIREDVEGEILGVFEDRKQCVEFYRSEGLRVFQVAEGNY